MPKSPSRAHLLVQQIAALYREAKAKADDVTVDSVLTIMPIRINVSTTTTVYLVARAKFATSTCKAYGTIYARRRR